MMTRDDTPIHETFNQRVVGSIPTALTRHKFFAGRIYVNQTIAIKSLIIT